MTSFSSAAPELIDTISNIDTVAPKDVSKKSEEDVVGRVCELFLPSFAPTAPNEKKRKLNTVCLRNLKLKSDEAISRFSKESSPGGHSDGA